MKRMIAILFALGYALWYVLLVVGVIRIQVDQPMFYLSAAGYTFLFLLALGYIALTINTISQETKSNLDDIKPTPAAIKDMNINDADDELIDDDEEIEVPE